MAARWWSLLLVGWMMTACRAAPLTPILAPLTPRATLSLYTATFAPTPTPNTNWVTLAPGFDRRELRADLPAGYATSVVVFRLDPALNIFKVLYTPAQPTFVSAWDRNARLVFNANFFDEHNAALGLLVSEGQHFGQAFVGFGGMFSITDDVPRVRSLSAEPYQPGEALDQAVQGFPMLLRPDGTRYSDEDDQRARRTVIAQDAEGRVYVLLATRPFFTLAEFAAWLPTTDLNLTIALNLDGGGSTGYAAGPNDYADSLTPVPAVVAVYAR